MKRTFFFVPAIIFTVFYGLIAMSSISSISAFVLVWLVLFFVSGLLLAKNIFWGALFGALPACHLIYMGIQDTGQIFSETPIGVAILVFYIVCGYLVFRKTKVAMSN